MHRSLYLGLLSALASSTVLADGVSEIPDASAQTPWQVASPPAGIPRFTDHGDGTVEDNLTGLVWLQDASCAALPKTDKAGRAFGVTAVAVASALADPVCGLTDGSQAGDWRLPNRFELESLLDLDYDDPALSDAAGTAKWTDGDPFAGVESSYYWTSATLASDSTYVWGVDLYDGIVFYAYEINYYYVWPVRGGQTESPIEASPVAPAD